MSEVTDANGFNVPPDQDFDTVGFQGSMQQVLQENIGNYVVVDFLIGTGSLVTKQGILYNVASQFLVLYDDTTLQYVVCDIFTVKFVTFLLPGYRPGQVQTPGAGTMPMPRPTPTPQESAPAAQATSADVVRTPSRAAYQYAANRAQPR